MENNGGREFISVTTARESGMRGVWGRTCGWIHVKSHDDSTWEGRTTETPLGPPDNWGAQVVLNEFPAKDSRQRCPVEGCPGVSATREAMRVHFVHRHIHNTVVILEEGNLPLPRCPRCDLQVSRKSLNRRNLETNQCLPRVRRRRSSDLSTSNSWGTSGRLASPPLRL